jgi:BirA family biotin operon repressor/biotin-[acetyl-CoA-carboxylase] ligase
MAATTAMNTKSASKPSRRERLLAMLSDGEFHSGEKLAARLKISRSAVWKIVGTLRAMGVEIESAAKQGYRLPQAVELYDADRLREAIEAKHQERIASIAALLQVDSTNRYLIDSEPATPGTAQVCIAEIQSSGRGRRGRSWLAPFGSGLCLSMAWSFDEAPPTLSALSLAVGVAVTRALRRFGGDSVQLKWPNDLVWNARKLGGILIEMRGESSGPTRVVIGLGLNLRMPATARLDLAKQQATLITDLHEILGDNTPGRNALLGAVIEELLIALQIFERQGFEAFSDEWRNRDALKDASVRVLCANESVNGVARGSAPDGALLVEVDGKVQRFVSGDVSLRAA